MTEEEKKKYDKIVGPRLRWYHKDNFIDGLIITALVVSPFLGNSILNAFESQSFEIDFSVLLLGCILWIPMSAIATSQLRDDNKLAPRQKLLKWLGIISTYGFILSLVYRMELNTLRQVLLSILFFGPFTYLIYWIFKK